MEIRRGRSRTVEELKGLYEFKLSPQEFASEDMLLKWLALRKSRARKSPYSCRGRQGA